MKNYLISIIMKEILKKKQKSHENKKKHFLSRKPLGFPDIIRDVWTTN